MNNQDVRDEILGVSDCPEVTWRGNPVVNELAEGAQLILVGGAITTRNRYRHFADSIAHLCDDGTVVRHGRQIGTKEDVIFAPNLLPNENEPSESQSESSLETK